MDKVVYYAEEALKGKLFVSSAIGFVKDSDDFWNDKLDDKTYQVYIHSLLILRYFTFAYRETNKEVYIDKAKEYLNRYLSRKDKSKYSWHEQSVAGRLNNILHFTGEYYKSEPKPKELNDYLKTHISFLLNDDNYKKNNHGIMMDSALASSLRLLNDDLLKFKKPIVEKVIVRAREAILRDFSEKGLHLENSPDYHRLTVKWLLALERKLNVEEATLGDEYVNKLKESEKLDAIIATPNNRYPIMGDSSDGQYKGEKSFDNFIDKTAGRAIFHNKKIRSQLTFIAGYGSKGHKHYDDLSFIFHDGKQAVFNDSGKYNYDKSSRLRNHVISPMAHNSLAIYKENYTISHKDEIKKKIYIAREEQKESYNLVQGYNKSYGKNIVLKRTLVFFEDNSILIYDKFKAEKPITAAVNFNLGIDVLTEKVAKGEFLIKGENNYFLKSHIGKFTSVQLDDTNFNPCIISNRFNTVEKNNRILFRQKTSKGAFLTTIVPESSELKIIKIREDQVTVSYRNQEMVIDLG